MRQMNTRGSLAAQAFLKKIEDNKEIERLLVTDHTVYMKESVFASFYLPYIVGEKTEPVKYIDPETGKRMFVEWRQLWLGHCKSFGVKVAVYDPVTRKILFDVPPLNYLAGVRRAPRALDNAADVDHYFLLKGSSRGGEEDFLEWRMIESAKEYVDNLDPRIFEAFKKSWDYILKRYTGVTIRLNETKVTEAPSKVVEAGSSVNEIIEYDEFEDD